MLDLEEKIQRLREEIFATHVQQAHRFGVTVYDYFTTRRIDPPKARGADMYRCPKCGATFATKEAFLFHIEESPSCLGKIVRTVLGSNTVYQWHKFCKTEEKEVCQTR